MEAALHWLGVGADIASVVSLGLTTVIVFRLRSLERRVVSRVAVPARLAQLKKNYDSLMSLLSGDTESRLEIDTLLARCQAIFEDLSPHLNDNRRAAVVHLKDMIASRNSSSVRDGNQTTTITPVPEEIMIEFTRVIQSLNSDLEEDEWRSRYVPHK